MLKKNKAQTVLEFALLLGFIAILAIVSMSVYNKKKIELANVNKIETSGETAGETAGILGYATRNGNNVQINLNGSTINCTITGSSSATAGIVAWNLIQKIAFPSSLAAYATGLNLDGVTIISSDILGAQQSSTNKICSDEDKNVDNLDRNLDKNGGVDKQVCQPKSNSYTNMICNGVNYRLQNGVMQNVDSNDNSNVNRNN